MKFPPVCSAAPVPAATLVLAVRNRQRERRVSAVQLRQLLRVILGDCLQLKQVELGVTLVAAPEMARLNWDFLQHEGATDIITFDHSEAQWSRREPPGEIRSVYGELWICVTEAVQQAKRFRVPWPQELTRYVIHGVLHLLGYDDHRPAARRAMKRVEERLLRRVMARFDVRRLDRNAASR